MNIFVSKLYFKWYAEPNIFSNAYIHVEGQNTLEFTKLISTNEIVI